MKHLLLLLLLALQLPGQSAAPLTVNDLYYGWNGGTNRIAPYGFPQYRSDSFAWHLDNTAAKTPRIYNTSDDALQNQFTTGADGNESCEVAKAWTVQAHARDVLVAIVDDSFPLAHPDLQGRWWINPDTGVPGAYITAAGMTGTNANVSDAKIHGGQAAGIIGAIGNNTNGVVGVCKDGVKIMAVATDGSYAALGMAVEYAATNGAKIILFAYGSNSQRTSWTNGFMKAQANGCLIIAAAVESAAHDVGGEYATYAVRDYPTQWGRSLSTNIIPQLTNLIVVSASIPDGTRYGIAGFSTNFVDVFFPGLRIPSTLPPANYATFNGTSPASAIAAGQAALLMQRHRRENAFQIKERMLTNVTLRTSYSTNCLSGGHANAYNALTWKRPGRPFPVAGIRVASP